MSVPNKVLLVLVIMISFIPIANALSVEIETDKPIYNYGDFLSFTIKVSEVTGEDGTLVIRDSSGKASTPIPVGIFEKATIINAPFPFESVIYDEGKYNLELEYSGEKDSTEFTLKDSGKIVIPTWIKEMTVWWIQGQINDPTYADGIKYLIKNDIIKISKVETKETSDEVTIPFWVKTNADWWVKGEITDGEFARAIQHLIKIGVIMV